MLDHIDGPAVRAWLKEWYALRDTPSDITMNSPKGIKLSEIAFRVLSDRGDNSVLAEHLRREVERGKEYR